MISPDRHVAGDLSGDEYLRAAVGIFDGDFTSQTSHNRHDPDNRSSLRNRRVESRMMRDLGTRASLRLPTLEIGG
jgi:hypothetical protein